MLKFLYGTPSVLIKDLYFFKSVQRAYKNNHLFMTHLSGILGCDWSNAGFKYLAVVYFLHVSRMSRRSHPFLHLHMFIYLVSSRGISGIMYRVYFILTVRYLSLIHAHVYIYINLINMINVYDM